MPLEALEPKKDNRGYFSGSQEFIIMEITWELGKWYHEFEELDPLEQAKYLAYYEDKGKMAKWQHQKDEERAKQDAKRGKKGT